MTTKLIIICDCCQNETSAPRDWNDANNGLAWTEVLRTATKPAITMRVEAQLGPNKHICKYCVIDAIKALDDRPKAEYRSTLKDVLVTCDSCGQTGGSHSTLCATRNRPRLDTPLVRGDLDPDMVPCRLCEMVGAHAPDCNARDS